METGDADWSPTRNTKHDRPSTSSRSLRNAGGGSGRDRDMRPRDLHTGNV